MQIHFLNPNNLPEIDYRTIQPLQGSLAQFTDASYEKLKTSLLKYGSFLPFYVWLNEGVPILLDGHGRLLLFTQENVNSKQDSSYLHPCLYVEAANLNEAKEKLLVIKSQYHQVTPKGFKEFTADMDIEWLEDTVNFDDLFKDIANSFDEEIFNIPQSLPIEKQRNEADFAKIQYLEFGKNKIPLTEEEFEKLQQAYQSYTQKFTTHYGFTLSLVESWSL